MRAIARSLVLTSVSLLAACTSDVLPNPPPLDRFYFPTGVVHADLPGSDAGVLYVASSNFDKRFDRGALTAVDLDRVGLPAFGAAVPADGPGALTDLQISESSQVYLQSFAGEMVSFPRGPEGLRLFVPSRAEGDPLQYVDAVGTQLGCGYAPPDQPRDCFSRAPSLVEAAGTASGKPRAPAPYGVGLSKDGELYITHLQSADSPPGSGLNLETFVVSTSAEAPNIVAKLRSEGGSFTSLGTGGANSVAVGERYAFLTGRFFSSIQTTQLVRVVNRQTGEVSSGGVEASFGASEARGIALSADGRRLFVVSRSPDVLLVVDVLETENPVRLEVVRSIPLPESPSEIALIERPAQGPLALVSSTRGDALAVYDEDVGQLVAEVADLGDQPLGIAVDSQGTGARIFVSVFGDGRVAVLDMPDLTRPYQVRTVAHLGRSQLCAAGQTDSSCVGGQP